MEGTKEEIPMKKILLLSLLISYCTVIVAQTAPIVYNVSASQRIDGSKIIDIYYDILDPDGDTMHISFLVSDDYGATWNIIPSEALVSGDIGEGIETGAEKHIIWNASEEAYTFEGNTYRYKIIADDDYSSGSETVIDYDGNVYQTVQIGNQIWMAENLKVTHYRNGDAIPNLTSDGDWTNTNSGAYCVYDNTPANADTYGNLYNWYAVDDPRGLAPEGWHIPTDGEIKELEETLGMSESEADDTGWRGSNEGSKLAGRRDLWDNGDLENDAEFGTSGFSLLPGGYRFNFDGNYLSMSSTSILWSSSENDSSAWFRNLNYINTNVYRSNYGSKSYGYSVRCVRD